MTVRCKPAETQQAGSILEIPILGRGDVPADMVDSVMLNVTLVNPDAPGFLTVFPCGTTPPQASNVNYMSGQVVANAALAKIGDDGKVCVFTLTSADIVVDVNGWFAPAQTN